MEASIGLYRGCQEIFGQTGDLSEHPDCFAARGLMVQRRMNAGAQLPKLCVWEVGVVFLQVVSKNCLRR